MPTSRPLAGALALGSIAIAALAEAMSLGHRAGWAPLALFGVAAVVATLAWLALGAPTRRADVR